MSFMYKEDNKGPRTVPWLTTDKTVRFYSIYNNLLLSEAKKRIYLFQCLATDSIVKQFAFKEFMRGCIKCLFKVEYECVNLSSIVQDFSPIIYYRSQLSFTTMSFPECMLPTWQEFMFIKMRAMIFEYTMCSSNIQKWDLGVFIFIEHIRKLTIEFLCLFEIKLSNTLSILPFQGWNTLGVFFLTIDVPIEVSGVCLNISNQVIHIQIVLFSVLCIVLGICLSLK